MLPACTARTGTPLLGLPYTLLLRLEGMCGRVLSLRGVQAFLVPHPALGLSNLALPVAFPVAGDPTHSVGPDGPPGLELWRMPMGNIRRTGGQNSKLMEDTRPKHV